MRIVFSIVFIGLLSACGGGGNDQSCVDRGSYFVPGVGTTDLHKRGQFCAPIELRGDEHQRPIVVQAEFEKSIIRIEPDGSVKWRYTLPEYFKGSFVDQTKDTISFTYHNTVIVINKHTGEYVSTETLSTGATVFATRIDKDLLAYVEHAANGKAVLTSKHGDLFRSTQGFSYARGVDLLNNHVLVVGDVFGHSVTGIDINTDSVAFKVEDYYPSMGLVIDSENILVVAEHSNRIYKYNVNTGAKTWVYGCKAHPVFTDLARPFSDILSLELAGVLTHADGKGICAIEHNEGKETLYSVGGVAQNEDGTLLISDTDNHRIVHIDMHGNFIREFRNINNPIRAVEIW